MIIRNNDLKRNFYYMYVHDVINDGMLEQPSLFDLVYPLFILSGILLFLKILRYWYRTKEKIKEKKE